MLTQTNITQGLNLLASIICSRVNILASIFWPCEFDFNIIYFCVRSNPGVNLLASKLGSMSICVRMRKIVYPDYIYSASKLYSRVNLAHVNWTLRIIPTPWEVTL